MLLLKYRRFLSALILLLPVFSFRAAAIEENSFSSLTREALDAVFPALRAAGGQAAALFGIFLLVGIAGSVLEKDGLPERITEAAGVLLAFLVLFSRTDGFLQEVRAASEDAMNVIRTALPTLAGASILLGKSASVVGSEAIYLLSADIASELITKFLLPGISALLFLAAIAAAFRNKTLSEAEKSLRDLIGFLLKAIFAVFVGYTTIYKAVGTIGDGIGKRSVKLAVNAAIPFVGGVASEAADSILAMASAARSTVGVGAILAMTAALLSPLVDLGVYALVFRAASLLIGPVGGSASAGFLRTISDIYSLLFAAAASLLLMGALSVLSVFLFVSL